MRSSCMQKGSVVLAAIWLALGNDGSLAQTDAVYAGGTSLAGSKRTYSPEDLHDLATYIRKALVAP